MAFNYFDDITRKDISLKVLKYVYDFTILSHSIIHPFFSDEWKFLRYFQALAIFAHLFLRNIYL